MDPLKILLIIYITNLCEIQMVNGITKSTFRILENSGKFEEAHHHSRRMRRYVPHRMDSIDIYISTVSHEQYRMDQYAANMENMVTNTFSFFSSFFFINYQGS